MKKLPRIPFLLLLLAVATTVGWSLLREEGVDYETSPVQRGNIESSVFAIGTLQPLDSVDIGAQVSGQITRIHVQLGDWVEKGQLLVEIDPSLLQATVDAERASLENLQAQLDEQKAQHRLARLRLERQQLMAANQATSVEALQEAETNLQTSAARIRQLQAQLQRTQSTLKGNEAELGYTRIYAPISGTVMSLSAKVGQTLNATYQTPTILQLADLGTMTVWTNVSEADIRRLKVGQRAWFTTLSGDGRRWDGHVRQVLPAPQTKEGETAASNTGKQVVQYTVLFDVDNPDRELMPMMTAQVAFVTESVQDVLTAPLPALTRQEGSHYQARVLTQEGKVEWRSLEVGAKDRLLAEVVHGLREGEQLITRELEPQARTRRLQW